MKRTSLLLLSLSILLSGAAYAREPESILLDVPGSRVRLPLEPFRSREEQARILTRRDQLLRTHVGGVGKSIRQRMSPVRNQGPRGTCSVFSAVALIEAFTGEDYSEQCLARLSGPRDAGFTADRLEYVRRNGVFYERDCPYDDTQRDRLPDVSRLTPRRFDAEFEAYPFNEDDPIAYLKSRLAVSSAVGIELFVVGKEQWQTGPFLYTPDARTIAVECGFLASCSAHAVVVTGLNDTLQLIEFKNSWGDRWGKGGYGYVSYDYFLTFGKGRMVSY